MNLTPTDFQNLLMDNGFPLPKFGADGHWGTETSNAIQAWFRAETDLLNANAPALPNSSGIVPADWMPDCTMDRVIIHWTAGAYVASENDREHYHILVDGNGDLVKGKYPITANVSTSDGDGYAAHTRNANTRSIGIAVCAMAGAVESPFNPGQYPMTQEQWQTLAQVAADLCRRYLIPIGPRTVLSHGEVQGTLGIAQSGKWDVNKLPWDPQANPMLVNDWFRQEVVGRL